MTDGNEGQVNAPTDWKDSLPEGIAAAPFIKAAATPEDAIAAINNAAQHMGNSLRIPGENAGEEDWNSFNAKLMEKVPNMLHYDGSDEGQKNLLAKLGLPDEETGYGIDNEQLAWLTEVGKQSNITKPQMKVLAEIMGKKLADEAALAEDVQKQNTEELDKLFGAAKLQKLANVEKLAELTEAPPAMLEALKNNQVDAATVAWLDGLAGKIGAEGQNLSGTTRDVPTMTPAEAEAQIGEILHNPAYFDAADPMHNHLKKKMVDLAKLANPTGGTGTGDLMAGLR